MTTALAGTTIRDPSQCFSGFLALIYRLRDELGFDIQYADLEHDVGDLDEFTGTIRIAQDAPLDDQAWFLNQVWLKVSIGAEAIDEGAVREPALYLVPTQRDVVISNLTLI